MRFYYLIFIIAQIVFFISCESECKRFQYPNQSLCYNLDITESNGVVDTLCEIYDSVEEKILVEVGYIKDGVRNGIWDYNYKNDIQKIEWAVHNDKYLNFKTNMLAYVDSIEYGPNYTKFKIKAKEANLRLSVFINNQIKDSLSEKKYLELFQKEFIALGYKVMNSTSGELMDQTNRIYTNYLSVEHLKNKNEKLFMKNACGFINNNDLIEVSIVSNRPFSFLANTLFNSVLTSFYYKGNRLFNPFY